MAEELPERLVPPSWLTAWAKAEVDAGADVVVMHGAPLLHGVEIYKGRPFGTAIEIAGDTAAITLTGGR